MSQYIEFEIVEIKPKTEIWNVVAKRDGVLLGVIKWFPRWRQYCFFPEPETVFSSGCILYVRQFIVELNSKHGR